MATLCRIPLVLLAALLSAGCGDALPAVDGGVDLEPPGADLAAAPPADLLPLPETDLAVPKGLVEHIIKPADTDPAIDKWLEDHYAYRDFRVAGQGNLVLFLAGASGTPSNTTAMLKEVAGYGFPVIGLRYCNDYAIVTICGADADPDCHGRLRLEALDGKDHHPAISVSPANSIDNRLARLLRALSERYPGEGWGAYLDGDKARWSRIIVSGISHGASAAGRIAKVRSAARVVMLSGPYDSSNGVAAPWTREASLTPASAFLGFSHTGDTQSAQHLKDFVALGMPAFGAVTSVEGARAPFGGSHQLTSAQVAKDAATAHSSTAAGGASPKQMDGSYTYRPVWRYLYGL